MPAVSVVMVFHQDTRFLRPAIASVLAQTLRDLELVLVDNGTGLPASALGDSGRDPRLRFVRLPRNEGIPGGHNAGVAAAQGEFVALLDYDDLALPHRLERQVAALRADPGLGLVSSLAETIDAEDRVTGRVFCLADPAAHRTYTQYWSAVVTPAITARREVLAALPYRAEFPVSGEFDFQARAFERWRGHVVPETLLRYRVYPAQTTQQRAFAIESSRVAIQLATARRRADRAEDLDSALALAAEGGESLAALWQRAAARSLAEGFPLLAAYQARRVLALGRSVPALRRALTLGWVAWRKAPAGERELAARLFLSGPVRAHRLRPG